MANWVAGHTGDRFRCIVTHASLWDTETMGRTTDNAAWERPMRRQNPRFNPRDSVREIVAPMLVIHGDKDYRVPIAQGHALWYDLHEFSATPRDEQGRTRHRYLYFPDEGHWIQGRGNAQVWYETFLGFLDEHVRGEAWERPATLG
jgi:dipeptidyl aminopeptidase/acylaminoacyl peptidase